MTQRYTSNVHVPGRIGDASHRVKLTVDETGLLLFAEHYVDGVLKGCGPSIAMLPRAVREECESRLWNTPQGCPMYWRAEQ